jgi:hypothetical protein
LASSHNIAGSEVQPTRELCFERNDAGRFDGGVGAGADRDADIVAGQRWGVDGPRAIDVVGPSNVHGAKHQNLDGQTTAPRTGPIEEILTASTC